MNEPLTCPECGSELQARFPDDWPRAPLLYCCAAHGAYELVEKGS